MSSTIAQLHRDLAGRASRKVATATVIRTLPDGFALRYHATDVVTARNDGTVTLNSGGWRTATTKKRINAYLPAGWSLFQSNFEWFLRELPSGRTLPFTDGITIADETSAPLGWSLDDTIRIPDTTAILNAI